MALITDSSETESDSDIDVPEPAEVEYKEPEPLPEEARKVRFAWLEDGPPARNRMPSSTAEEIRVCGSGCHQTKAAAAAAKPPGVHQKAAGRKVESTGRSQSESAGGNLEPGTQAKPLPSCRMVLYHNDAMPLVQRELLVEAAKTAMENIAALRRKRIVDAAKGKSTMKRVRPKYPFNVQIMPCFLRSFEIMCWVCALTLDFCCFGLLRL